MRQRYLPFVFYFLLAVVPMGQAWAGSCEEVLMQTNKEANQLMFGCAAECKDTFLSCENICQRMPPALSHMCKRKCARERKSCFGLCRRAQYAAKKQAENDYQNCIKGGVCNNNMTYDPELDACCPDAIYVVDCLCEPGQTLEFTTDYDENGCVLGYGCECVGEPCPPLTCSLGYVPFDTDGDGCNNECVPVVEQCQSNADCKNGEVCSVSNGDCQLCIECPECDNCCGVCEPETVCDPDNCGPALGMPNYECSDGKTIAGPGECVVKEDGTCGWEIITCPDGCAYNSQWYVPGEIFPADDMCNTCYCQGDGYISCTEKACLEECTGGQVWNYCGSACTATCSDPDPICTLQCVAKCECPLDMPLWDGNQCIKPSDCVLCPDGSDPVNCFAAPCDVSTCPAYPNAECADNYCGGCNAEYYVDGEKVDCMNHTLSCTTDADCGSSHWCRPTEKSNSMPAECVPYVEEGESCGGFVLFHLLEQCS